VELTTQKDSGKAFASAAEALAFVTTTLDFLVTRCVEAASHSPYLKARRPLAARRACIAPAACAAPTPAAAAPALPCAALPPPPAAPPLAPSTAPPRPCPGPRAPSRPTAVNLADACNRLRATATAAAAVAGATGPSVAGAVVAAAEAYFAEDLAANRVSDKSISFMSVIEIQYAGQQTG
jgi:hypothetical protein